MRSRILLALALLFVAVPALAATEQPHYTAPVTAGGLTCFSVTPASPPELTWRYVPPNCRELCATRGAACIGVAVGLYTPPPNCDSRALSPTMTSCNCCAVAK